MTIKNRLWILMSRKLSGSSTLEEDRELDELFKNDPDAWFTYEVLSATEDQDGIPKQFKHEIQSLLQQDIPATPLSNPVKEAGPAAPSPKKQQVISLRKWHLATLAAVFTGLVISCGYLFFNGRIASAEAKINEIVARNGNNTEVTLPDGSKIRLNAGSKLTYPKDLASAAVREVTLSGEAYFKVIHDPAHPFLIHTPYLDIHDLGTTFNVKAYPGEPRTETALIEGALEIALPNSNGSGKIRLKPREKLIFYNDKAGDRSSENTSITKDMFKISGITPTREKDEFVETAWIQNRLIVNNKTFAEVARMLERRYGLEITIRDEEIKKFKLTCTFEDETRDEAIKYLQLMTSFHYTVQANKVIVEL